jgi:hypothetical protein
MKRIITTAVAIGLVASAAFAQPSQYWVWRDNATGETKCDPESPGKKWVKVSGPFEDSNCTIAAPK